jgi:cardiolipin synthase
MREREKNVLLALPNIISLFRILLIPVLVLMIIRQKTAQAFVVLLLAAFTDVLDGFIARVLKLKTKFGALLDPAADKLLITTSFILLTIPRFNSPNVIPLWLTAVVIGKDLFLVSGAFLLFKLRGQKTFPPSIPGKASTVCQIMVVLIILLFNLSRISSPFLNWLYFLTLAATILSALHYFRSGLRIASRSG